MNCEPLAENHERIWLQPLCCVDERCWCSEPQGCEECDLPPIEYVRKDLAAAENERLSALWIAETRENEQLRAALKPFADLMGTDSNGYESSADDEIVRSVGTFGRDYRHITVGDLRRAVTAFGNQQSSNAKEG